MGHYVRGDVILVSVALDDRTSPKARPVIVIASDEPGILYICPVSSKPPSDAPSLPLSLSDFASGGLDIFGESFVMTSRVLTIQSGDVIGKKGRLTAESIAEISGLLPTVILSGLTTKETGRTRKGR
jgi:mRNA-degrading endonuclease toxin of MazEF toxin-antitoxin module